MHANKERYQTESQYMEEMWGIDPDNPYRLITKVGSFDDFDRYRFPFLKDDVVFALTFSSFHLGLTSADHKPEKYAVPKTPQDTDG